MKEYKIDAIKELNKLYSENKELEKLANEANERANDYAIDFIKINEDLEYYKDLSNDFQRKLKAAHQDFSDFIQKQKNQIDNLEQENAELKAEIRQYKKYKFLFEKAKEFKEKTDKWAAKCLEENEDLKDTIKRTVCQAECFRYKQATKYKQTLQEIKEIAEFHITDADSEDVQNDMKQIIDLITKAEEE